MTAFSRVKTTPSSRLTTVENFRLGLVVLSSRKLSGLFFFKNILIVHLHVDQPTVFAIGAGELKGISRGLNILYLALLFALRKTPFYL